jgi:hypothetical protein
MVEQSGSVRVKLDGVIEIKQIGIDGLGILQFAQDKLTIALAVPGDPVHVTVHFGGASGLVDLHVTRNGPGSAKRHITVAVAQRNQLIDVANVLIQRFKRAWLRSLRRVPIESASSEGLIIVSIVPRVPELSIDLDNDTLALIVTRKRLGRYRLHGAPDRVKRFEELIEPYAAQLCENVEVASFEGDALVEGPLEWGFALSNDIPVLAWVPKGARRKRIVLLDVRELNARLAEVFADLKCDPPLEQVVDHARLAYDIVQSELSPADAIPVNVTIGDKAPGSA